MTEPTTPRIEVRPDGPYVVHDVPLTRKRMVETEHGEPVAWQTGADIGTRSTYLLCRCGHSAAKPFCDGAHARVGFLAAEPASASSYDERATTYEGTHIVVRDDRSVCVHAGFCGNRVTNIWNMVGGSGTDDTVVRAQIIAMVERCPSGALTYRVDPEGPDVEPDLRTAIGVVDDGPLYVTGGVTVECGEGTELEARPRVTLCRCGASANKPLCDGSHKDVGFHDAG